MRGEGGRDNKKCRGLSRVVERVRLVLSFLFFFSFFFGRMSLWVFLSFFLPVFDLPIFIVRKCPVRLFPIPLVGALGHENAFSLPGVSFCKASSNQFLRGRKVFQERKKTSNENGNSNHGATSKIFDRDSSRSFSRSRSKGISLSLFLSFSLSFFFSSSSSSSFFQ